MKSSDGIRWSPPVEVLRDQTGTGLGLLSPAVIHDGSLFVMWAVEKIGDEFKITRRTSEDGTNWSDATVSPVQGLEDGRCLWHLDVIRERDRLSTLVVTTGGSRGEGQRIHYGYSLDQGHSWFIGPFLFDQSYEFESGIQYRGTLLQVAEEPHCYQLWYSAASKQFMWSIAYLQMTREGNSLRPGLQ